ncbi:hypothetical protein A2U01_0096152, partial [Trifolium medium]|nr:hypothetical protein [Trifolium medium]
MEKVFTHIEGLKSRLKLHLRDSTRIEAQIP